jgi:hypothetical protein
MPPMLMRLSVASVRLRPLRLTNGTGAMKPITRRSRYRFGRICQLAMSCGDPWVTAQKSRRERTSGMERKVAMR